jgi:hypothetical protein
MPHTRPSFVNFKPSWQSLCVCGAGQQTAMPKKGKQAHGFSSKGERSRVESWHGTHERPPPAHRVAKKIAPAPNTGVLPPRICSRGQFVLRSLLCERVRDDIAETANHGPPQQQQRVVRCYGPGTPWSVQSTEERRSARDTNADCKTPKLSTLCAQQVGKDLQLYTASPDLAWPFSTLPSRLLARISRAAAAAEGACSDATAPLLCWPSARSLTLVSSSLSDCGAAALLPPLPVAAAPPADSWEDTAGVTAAAELAGGCPSLLELDLSSPVVTSATLRGLVTAAPLLRRLALSGCTRLCNGLRQGEDVMALLGSFTALLELDLSSCSWCDDLALKRLALCLAAQAEGCDGAAALTDEPWQQLEQSGDSDNSSSSSAPALLDKQQQQQYSSSSSSGISCASCSSWRRASVLELYCAGARVTPEGARAAVAAASGMLRIVC